MRDNAALFTGRPSADAGSTPDPTGGEMVATATTTQPVEIVYTSREGAVGGVEEGGGGRKVGSGGSGGAEPTSDAEYPSTPLGSPDESRRSSLAPSIVKLTLTLS